MDNKFNLIQVNAVLEHESIKPYYKILSRPIIADIIRETLDKLRYDFKKNSDSNLSLSKPIPYHGRFSV